MSEIDTLPNPGDDLILADGTRISVKDGSVSGSPKNETRAKTFVEVPRFSEAQEIVMRTRRRVAELPVPPKSMNAVAVVVAYHFYGLDSADIAIAMQLSEKQIDNIFMSEAFTEMKTAILRSMTDQGASDVRTYFAKASKNAAVKMVELMENANDEKTQQKAAADILDRAGHRPVDTVEHKIRMENDLVIRIVKPEAENKELELTFNGDSYGDSSQ